MTKQGVGIGLDNQNVQRLQQVARVLQQSNGPGRRQHFDGQYTNNLLFSQNGK